MIFIVWLELGQGWWVEKFHQSPLGSGTEKIPGSPALSNTGRRRSEVQSEDMKHDPYFLAWSIN